MAKKSRTKTRDQATPEGEVGPRQPCPCGSGKRYKACHGAGDAATAVYVTRPFAGLAGECDLVALRELVPAATASLTLRDPAYADVEVLLCSLLPMAAPAMKRDSGAIWLGLQVQHSFGDPSRDLGAVLSAALDAEPGIVGLSAPPGPGPRLQDLVADTPLEVTVHDRFDYWVADVEGSSDVEDLEAATPTARLSGVEAAYWTRMGAKEHLRWVLPEPEDALLTALARLHVSGKDVIVPEARLVGMFRAHGLLTPVWDLAVDTGAQALEEPAAAFAVDLATALADDSPLSAAERAARSGLANRQVTIR